MTQGRGGLACDCSLDGCSDSSRLDVFASLACNLSASSGTSTTDALLGLGAVPPRACTSASLGSSCGSGSGSGSGFGFDKFGSSPAFTAFSILTAWNFAYLIF